MPNANLVAGLRGLLNNYGMPDADIDQAIAGELKEVSIEHAYGNVVAAIADPNNGGFTIAFNGVINGLGGVWKAPVWDLSQLALTMPLSAVAPEELSAITTHGPTPGFDAGKALTNLLRLIKAG